HLTTPASHNDIIGGGVGAFKSQPFPEGGRRPEVVAGHDRIRAYGGCVRHFCYSAATARPRALSLRYCSMPAAASRPSLIAHTTSEAPRTMSPAAKTPSIEVAMVR